MPENYSNKVFVHSREATFYSMQKSPSPILNQGRSGYIICDFNDPQYVASILHLEFGHSNKMGESAVGSK